MIKCESFCMRLRRTGSRGPRARGTRSRPSQIKHYSIQNTTDFPWNYTNMVRENIAIAERNSMKDTTNGDISNEESINSLKNSKPSLNKITNYFSNRSENGPESLLNGVSEDHISPPKTKLKGRPKHKVPPQSSSPTKENKKLANGCCSLPEEIKSNVCTRSQSQKKLSSNVGLNTDWVSPIKEKEINRVLNSPAVKTLDFSPVKKEASPLQHFSPVKQGTTLLSSPKGDDVAATSSPQAGPPTPHKIQALNEEKLRLDTPLSASNALSKLQLLSPNKLNLSESTKNKRKLPKNKFSIANFTINACETNTKTEKKPPILVNGALSNNTVASKSSTMRNTQMTEFFPIRRSHRKPKTTLIQEKQRLIEERIKSGKEEGLRIQNFGAKGRGIVTTRDFAKGEMVIEYVGVLIDIKKAKVKEQQYALDNSKGCYMYYFNFQDTQYCIDATEESTYFGRLVNHSRNGNLSTKTVEVYGSPHLILIAKKDISKGSEVLYDYGDRSKQSLKHHPWLAL